MNKFLTVTGVVALVVWLIFIGPWLVIWALNTLFNTGIVVTWQTWIATAILLSILQNTVKIKKD
jgi:hypothetical protein